MRGVKSITNMSANDLAAQGNLNKNGNLAHVKSTDSMGRADSFAFLEVFFDSSGMSNSLRGVKRERDEDDDIGLNLDADESPLTNALPPALRMSTAGPTTVPLSGGTEAVSESDTLKRAYDDALAARGLMSVSRSCENLSEIALPPKMQRTLSQEYIRRAQRGGHGSQNFNPFSNPSFISSSTNVSGLVFDPTSQQLNLQSNLKSNAVFETPQSNARPTETMMMTSQQLHPRCHRQPDLMTSAPVERGTERGCVSLSDPSMNSASIEVPATTKCALCNQINVDTQLRPCGHMFHGRCLKPSLQNAMGPPCCPIDNIPMHSAVLAIPTDEKIVPADDLAGSAPTHPKLSTLHHDPSLQLKPWGTGNIPTFHMPMAGPTSQSSKVSTD